MNRSAGAGRFTLRVLKRRQPPSVKHFYQRSLDAEDLAAPPAAAASSVRGSAAKCLEMISRLLNGEFSLGSGRHVAPRFLQPLMSGEDVLNFSSESDEFRRQLGKQLQELRQTLKKGQRMAPKAESEKTARSWRSRRGESEESERRPGDRPVRGESEESEKTRAARTPEPKKASQDPRKLGRRSDKAVRSESEESEESEGSERYPYGALRVQRTSSEPKRSNRAVRSESEESEESERYPRAGRSNRAIKSESEESEESERYPYGALRNPRAVRTPEPKKAGSDPRRSNRTIRSESEESEESELRPRSRNYQPNPKVSESEKTLKGSTQSSRKVRAESEESEESEKIAESEESERQPKPRDPNLIEGIYWTGEGKRLEVRDPREGKKPDSGYIAGDGRDLNAEPSDAPRGQTSSKDLKDE